MTTVEHNGYRTSEEVYMKIVRSRIELLGQDRVLLSHPTVLQDGDQDARCGSWC
jgi:hypothetical protein